MWRVDRPTRDARSTFLTCVERVRDEDLRRRLKRTDAEIAQASGLYASAAAATELHSLRQADFFAKDVTAEELISVYKSRFAKKGAPGRFIYDEIIVAAAHGRCPLCGQRSVSTLDHHLPKALYPVLSVDPLNLIPACADCNHLKRSTAPRVAEDQTLHPYFDDVESDPWLYAEVLEGAPVALRFRVDPPSSWSVAMAARVRLHFKTFRLAPLYASQSAQELQNIKHNVERLFGQGGTRQVRRYLRDEAESRRAALINSWQTATYTALADSEWYCSNGFRA